MTMDSSTSSMARSRLLPEAASSWLARRAIELAGAVCAAAALWLLLSLITWTPGDPSFGHDIEGPVLNAAGRTGAYGAQAMLAWFGLAAGAPVLVLGAWALRLILRHRPPPSPALILLTPLGMILIGLALSLLGWPRLQELPAGAEGIFGRVAAFNLASLEGFPLSSSPWLGVLALLLGLAALAFAMALTRRDLSRPWRPLAKGGLRCLSALSGLVGFAAGMLRARLAPPRSERSRFAGAEAGTEAAVGPGAAEEAAATAPRSEKPAARRRVSKRKDTASARRKPVQTAIDFDGDGGDGGFALPSLELLATVDTARRPRVDEEGLEQNARMLEVVLSDFGIRGEIVDVRPGPVVTLYELEPVAGIRASRVIGLADDIARNMSALAARVAVIPGRTVLGIELPNTNRETVILRELLESKAYAPSGRKLPIALGKEISGAPVVEDLAMMPHLLVAGTTGSGKSVAINAMILSLLYKLTPAECRLILIDPKMLELSVYDDIPHLLAPVVTEPGKAVVALKWAVREMENRYRAMQKVGVRNMEGFNKRVEEARAQGLALTRTVQTGFDSETGEPMFEDETIAEEPLPYIVIVVDEMADLMLVAGRDIEGAIQRLAQMARAAGIHLIMATQRPSVDVITGTIKANFPCRVSFHVTSKIDSRTILGEQGAEQLLGKGDLLFMRGGARLTRIHGPFVSDDEVQRVATLLRRQGEPDYLDAVTEEAGGGDGVTEGPGAGDGNEKDKRLYDEAVFLVTREQKASTSFVQRHLKIGYNRAASIIEQMERDGVVSPANHVGKREVLAPPPA